MERTSAPQPSARRCSRQLPKAGANSVTRVPIGRNAGGHAEAGMESEEGMAFESLPRRSPYRGGSRLTADDPSISKFRRSLLKAVSPFSITGPL
jgi:hypothetical protein